MISKKSKIKNKSYVLYRNYIIQKYIANPHLINWFKYDLRIYVLITSFDPLRIYLYDNGLVRFATWKYSTTNNSCKKRYVHLTNYAVNKKSPNFIKNKNLQVLFKRMMDKEVNGVYMRINKN